MMANICEPVQKANEEIQDSGHKIFEFPNGPDHTLILLVYLPIMLGYKKLIRMCTYLF